MTSASVALHESNLSLHADTLVLRWTCVHHGKVMRHRNPDEWRITCACANAGLTACRRRARGRPCPPGHAKCFGWQTPPSQHGPRSLAPLTWGGRQPAGEKSPAADGATYFGRAHPSIVSLSHVTYSCFSGLTTLPDRAFQFWVRHKKGRGEEKLTWPLFSERAGTERRTRLRANKSRAPPQKKLPVHPYGFPQHSRPYKTPWAPKETIKRSVPTHRNVCKESACTKAICNFTKWQT